MALTETSFGVLSGQTILCFAADAWGGAWRNRHQIMTRLARENTVLYVEPRLYLGETVRRLAAGRLGLADLRRPLAESYRDGLWIYHDPYYAPYAGRLSGGKVTARWRRRALHRTLDRLGAGAPILWLLRPIQADQIGQHGEKLVVYHVTDEYSAYPQEKDPAAFRQAEIALLRRADLVIVTSPGLLASKGIHNPHTYLVPNAVDYAGFQAALASGRKLSFPAPGVASMAGADNVSALRADGHAGSGVTAASGENVPRRSVIGGLVSGDWRVTDPPGAIFRANGHAAGGAPAPSGENAPRRSVIGGLAAGAGRVTDPPGAILRAAEGAVERSAPGATSGPSSAARPCIGYVGALNEKLDLALLRAVALARPGWQFLVIGFWTFYDQPGKLDLVRGLPNVLLPGRVPVEDVPLAIAACDVCILPYERNAWTQNIDSLKLYEYLACGRPVVSTDIPAARVFGDLVRIADDPAGFVAAIEAALAEDTPALAAQRRAAAAANTWDMRVAQISELLAAALARKAAGGSGA